MNWTLFFAALAALLGGASVFQRRDLGEWARGGLEGQTYVITGGSAGLGAETALMAVEWGAERVVIACRNATKAAGVVADIERRTGRAVVEAWDLDLASLASVRAFASRAAAELSRLDVLINNAGMVPSDTSWRTGDGYESSFQVNFLGHDLLTRLLMPLLRASAPSRVVHVSSGAHYFAMGGADLAQTAHALDEPLPMVQYGRTKLLTNVMSRELARREAELGSGVASYTTHPGMVKTEIVRAYGTLLQWANEKLGDWFLRDVRQGAKTTMLAATATGLESGRYYVNADPAPAYELLPSDVERVQKEQWEAVEGLLAPYLN